VTWAGLGGACVLVHGRDEVTATVALGPGLGLVSAQLPTLGRWTALLGHLGECSARVDRLTHLLRVVSGEPHAFLTARVRAGRAPVEPPVLAAALVEDLHQLVIPFLGRAGIPARPLPMPELAALVAHCFCPSRPLGGDVGLTPTSAYPAAVEAADGWVRADGWWHATAAARTHADALADECVAAVAALDVGAAAVSDVVPAGGTEQDTLTVSVTVSAPSRAELDAARAELSGLVGWGWPRDQAHAFAAAALPFARLVRFIGPAVPSPRPFTGPSERVVPPDKALVADPADLPTGLADVSPPMDDAPDLQVPVWSSPISAETRPGWFWLGAHGGAGVTTLALASADDDASAQGWGLDAERAWPLVSQEPSRWVVVVARTHMSGLLRAREMGELAREGAVPEGTDLLGVALVADAPGGWPQELVDTAAGLAALYPRVWTVPYIEQLRLLSDGEPPPAHPGLTDVIHQIRIAATEEGHS